LQFMTSNNKNSINILHSSSKIWQF
jgi:hypothetical protein